MSSDQQSNGQDLGRRDALRLLTRVAAGSAAAAATPLAAGAAAGATERPHLNIASLFSLQDKVAVLTDVGGGGSREVALLLAAAGAHVVIADRVYAPARALAAQIVAAGGHAVAFDTDIESEASVVALFQDVAKAAGRVDILVNCAGMLARQPLVETTVQQWDDVQSLNLRANFLCMREGVKQMLAAGRGGRIVNITTIGALHPVMNGNEAYGAARLGVTGLSRTTALDYAPDGILVNTVLAGAIPGKVSFHPTTAAALKAGRKMGGPILQPGRLPFGDGDMTDVAAAVLYLVSPAGRYMTGQSMVLDGGFLLT
ncbi:SDR family oxidoreductase [Phenylobacterium sp.]|uniref:SDR family NAD(P)-dependent oxidoreductase n=1 Tax=Phenylobacterium sp. TaxID=1871053 RepID=UPI002F3E9324